MRQVVYGVLVLLAGCATEAQATPPPETPEPPAFDVASVRSSFTDECSDPIMVDETFCVQVNIDGMTAEGTTLIVPTTLSTIGMQDRAFVICDLIARLHFDGEGNDLGFEVIGVRDREGGNAAACTVRR